MENETVTVLVEIINQTGFPIAACIGLFWIMNKTLKAQHEILLGVKKSIDNNTQAINEMSKKHDV